jgi:hypothetical protein
LRAGARPEDVRQAEAQVAAARADAAAADAEVAAAQTDVDRFERLLASSSGTRKQRDDAVARRDVARERAVGTRDRIGAARENVARLRAGARAVSISSGRGRRRGRRAPRSWRMRASSRNRADRSSRLPISIMPGRMSTWMSR